MENSKPTVIAIDHGNSHIKTKNSVFPAGYTEKKLDQGGTDIVVYDGVEYTLSEKKVPHRNDKTEDDDYFRLTLFAIGIELTHNMDTTKDNPKNISADVVLVVGSPPEHMSKEEAKSWTDYFMPPKRANRINFVYNNIDISIKITEVVVFPQALSAALTIRNVLKDYPFVNVVDIGGLTVDVLRILEKFQLDQDVVISLQKGVNNLFEHISREFRKRKKYAPDDRTIHGVLVKDESIMKHAATHDDIKIIQEVSKTFTEKLLKEVQVKARADTNFDLEKHQTLFIGGGSILLKDFITDSDLVQKPIFIEDIKANVKGYEMLYNSSQKPKAKNEDNSKEISKESDKDSNESQQ